MRERDIKFKITKAEEGAAFVVHVVPKSKKNEIAGRYSQGDALKVRLTAKSTGDTANEALLNILSEKLKVNRQQVEIAAGLASAEKMIVVLGITPTQVESRLLS